MSNEYLFRTTRKERGTVYVLSLVFALFFGLAFAKTPVLQETKLEVVKVGTAYVPPGNIFGLYNQTGFVASPYAYEASLVNYSIPVADSDYILKPGSQELVHLPGWSNDKYTLVESGYISGSGGYETWQAPNGGYVAFLHLSNLNIQSTVGEIRTKSSVDSIAKQCSGFSGNRATSIFYSQYCLNDDRTGLVVSSFFPVHVHVKVGVGQSKTGGYVLGRSGWPTDPYYGNGEAGPYNAHLCVIYDQAGANWLAYVSHQPEPVVKPVFRLKNWNAWTVKHKKKSISPYYGKSLDTIARIWTAHQKECGGVIANWVYESKDMYTYQKFQGCVIYSWSKKSYKPKITKNGRWVT